MCDIKDGHDYSKDARKEMNGNGGVLLSGWNKLVIGVMATVFVAWMGWVSLMLISVDQRVAVIEGNRFDSRDAMLHAEADRQMESRVSGHIAQPGHPVLIERVGSMQVQLDRMEAKIDELKD